MKQHTRHFLYAAVLAFLAPAVAEAQLCHDFESDQVGPEGPSWSHVFGVGSYIFVNADGGDLYIVDSVPLVDNQSIFLNGGNSAVHSISPAIGGAAPLTVDFLIRAADGDIEIYAYKADMTTLLDSDSVSHATTAAVSLDGGGSEIAYITIVGGAGEIIDEICIDD